MGSWDQSVGSCLCATAGHLWYRRGCSEHALRFSGLCGGVTIPVTTARALCWSIGATGPGREASSAEGDALLAVDLLDEAQDQGDLRRAVSLARAHDDRRDGFRLVERPIDDVLAPEAFDLGRDETHPDFRRHQAERGLQFANLVHRGGLQAALTQQCQ